MRVDTQEQAVAAVSAPVRPEPVREIRPVEAQKPVEKSGADQLAKKAGKPVNTEALTEAIELANKVMELTDRHLVFKMHEKSGRVQVSVVETGSQGEKVIRQIPSDKMLEMAAQFRESMHEAAGLLLNEIV